MDGHRARRVGIGSDAVRDVTAVTAFALRAAHAATIEIARNGPSQRSQGVPDVEICDWREGRQCSRQP